MSENEKAEQIGKLAEEYSETRLKLNHIEEKLTRARLAFSILSNIQSFNAMKVADGVLVAPFPPHFNATPRPVEGLLSNEQIIQVLAEKEQYSLELAYLAERLKALTPHLLP